MDVTTLSDNAKAMLARMQQAGRPVPAPANPGLEELEKAGFVDRGTLPAGAAPYPGDYSVWTLTGGKGSQ